MIKAIEAINANVRKWVARFLIVVGIVIAYTPYWVEQNPDNVGDSLLMQAGWWVLAIGLVLYALNVWLDIKAEKEDA